MTPSSRSSEDVDRFTFVTAPIVAGIVLLAIAVVASASAAPFSPAPRAAASQTQSTPKGATPAPKTQPTPKPAPAPKTPSAPKRVNATGAAEAEFERRVADYAKLHKQMEDMLPQLPKDATPQQIDANQRALEKLI